jgi:hypothetical protein
LLSEQAGASLIKGTTKKHIDMISLFRDWIRVDWTAPCQEPDKLGGEITHYGWRGIDLDAALSESAACNGQASVVIATATKVHRHLGHGMLKGSCRASYRKPVAYRTDEVQKTFDQPPATLERSVSGFMMRYHPVVK